MADPLPPRVPMVPAEGAPKLFELKSSWRQWRRNKNLAVSLQHWKGRRGGGGKGGPGGVPPPPPTVYGRSNTSPGSGWGEQTSWPTRAVRRHSDTGCGRTWPVQQHNGEGVESRGVGSKGLAGLRLTDRVPPWGPRGKECTPPPQLLTRCPRTPEPPQIGRTNRQGRLTSAADCGPGGGGGLPLPSAKPPFQGPAERGGGGLRQPQTLHMGLKNFVSGPFSACRSFPEEYCFFSDRVSSGRPGQGIALRERGGTPLPRPQILGRRTAFLHPQTTAGRSVQHCLPPTHQALKMDNQLVTA